MDVLGISKLTEPKDSGRVDKAQVKKGQTADKNALSSSDEVVISDSAKSAFKDRSYVKMVQELPEVRQELVEKIKAQVANGSIPNDEMIKKTADKMMNGILEDLA